MNTKHPQSKSDLKDALLERIDVEQLCPRSRLSFVCQECLVWSSWLLSVVVGALAVAVSLFVMTHGHYALYEATHENFLTFMIDALPYLWLVIFAVTAYLAIYNLRHTRKGYKYSLTALLLGGLVLSLVGGSVLQLFGFGYAVDDTLGRNMPLYQSQYKLEQKIWQMPKDGRLVGVQVSSVALSTSTIIFKDVTGQQWQMNTTELRPRQLELLASGKTVRLLGECTNKEQRIFQACGVFPWMIEEGVTVQDMVREKRAFVAGVQDYADRQSDRPLSQLNESASTSSKLGSVCAEVMKTRGMFGLRVSN